MYDKIKAEDSEVYSAIMQELGRQRDKIELIASEISFLRLFSRLQALFLQINMQRVIRERLSTPHPLASNIYSALV